MPASPPPALLLTHGRIHLRADDEATVEALLVVGGRVLAAGADAELRGLWPRRVEVFDVRGRFVLPGLCDAHLHLEKYARAVGLVDCETTTPQACLDRVRARALSTSQADWVVGHGWNQNDW